jgi:glycine betaine/proline transport system ATP-binding protein
MVHNVVLALRSVAAVTVEGGLMACCTRRQLLWQVQVPASLPRLALGLNQIVMMTLNMVIIASMIGAGGLGYDVLTALRKLDFGTDLLAADERALIDIRRNGMGMVFQNFALLPHRTVLDNIAFPLQAQGRPRAGREARAREMAALVGLAGWETRYPSKLSGGQQQRVGIARSLATDPALWFLDEPFSALDPLIRADLQEELSRLQSQLGKTVVFVTHDLDEAIRPADRIAIVEAGRIVQTGTPEKPVLAPVNDYVCRFVARVPVARVMQCGHLAVEGPATGGLAVPATATVASAASRVIGGGADADVVDAGGRFAGRLPCEALNAILAADQRRHAGVAEPPGAAG